MSETCASRNPDAASAAWRISAVLPSPDSPRITSTPLRPARASASSRSSAWRSLDRPRNAGGRRAAAISSQRYPLIDTRDFPGRDEHPIAGPCRRQPQPPKEDTMSTIDTSTEKQVQLPETGTVDFKLEVVVVPVADVDRAKQFYVTLGWREDVD